MKINIPDGLKADMPQTLWGKVLSATPIVMTVIATMLAGLASSEMTRAQYDRALAAQQQSKSGDQWSFFQAKRLRGAVQRGTLDMIENSAEVPEFDAAALQQAGNVPANGSDSAKTAALRSELRGVLDSAAGQTALGVLTKGEYPDIGPGAKSLPAIKTAQEAIDSSRPAAEIAKLLGDVPDAELENAIHEAKDEGVAFDAANKPVSKTIDQIESLLTRLLASQEQTAAGSEAAARATLRLKRSYSIARLRVTAERYDAEARLNQVIGGLLELQVRKSNLSAERHHLRSQRFFYGMLAGQMGVIIATFAMAARKRSLLWSLAAAAGVAALSFAFYVYLFV